MAGAYHVDTEQSLVLFRPTGRFDETNFIDLCRVAFNDRRRDPQFAHVWDTRGIEELVMDEDVISMYRDLLVDNADRVTRARVAVIATRAVTRTFASMLIQVGKDHPATFQLFERVEGAAGWIGIPAFALTNVPEGEWSEV